jgi:hypothetical protein
MATSTRKPNAPTIISGLNMLFGALLAVAFFGPKAPPEAAALIILAATSLAFGPGLFKSKPWVRPGALIDYSLQALLNLYASRKATEEEANTPNHMPAKPMRTSSRRLIELPRRTPYRAASVTPYHSDRYTECSSGRASD